MHVVFYEYLCLEPRNGIDRLFSFLGKTYDPEVFRVINKSSPLARKESAVRTSSSVIDEWRKHVTEGQLERAIDILRVFGLDKVYSERIIAAREVW